MTNVEPKQAYGRNVVSGIFHSEGSGDVGDRSVQGVVHCHRIFKVPQHICNFPPYFFYLCDKYFLIWV